MKDLGLIQQVLAAQAKGEELPFTPFVSKSQKKRNNNKRTYLTRSRVLHLLFPNEALEY